MTSQNDSWHAMPIEQVLTQTGSSLIGLEPSEAIERLHLYGANTLPEGRRTPWIIRFLAQFQSPLIYILLVASAISYALRETIDGSVILLITFFNAVIGFIQEHKAERALEALKKMSAPTAKVMRSSEVTEIPSEQLVMGDIVILETGDSVPADVRLIEATRLKVDESVLTGETVSVEKSPEQIPYDTPLTDRRNMLYMGTSIVSGRGLGVVVATGDNTQIGQIAKEVQTTPTEQTPLQQKLAQIGQLLGMAGVAIALLLVVIGLWRQFLLKDLFFTAVAAAVSFIPEGLPAVVTIVLAVGVQRMAHRNAIIRKLPAVETLGSATVICTDKTGTITKNEMTARICWTLSAQFHITGDGYQPEGQFRLGDTAINPDDFPDLKLALIITTLCNDSYITKQDGGWRVTGDPTEGALIVAAAKAGLKKTILEEQYKRIDELPFESQARYMATLNVPASGPSLLCVKGAPERILEMCTHIRNHGQNEPLSSDTLNQVLGAYHSMAAEAYRMLAVAYKELPGTKREITHADAEEGLVFVGLIAMLDPPRPEVFDAVRRAKLAGIRIIMITGDNAITAEAIARDVGILDGEEIVTGEELETMSSSELAQRIHRIAVFARTEPRQKYRIVEALKRNGELVAMTGDGANDAPALKLADIGIAMGITGTDVAREAADMILADDNFATIVAAVEEGRVIFANLRKVVEYLLATNTGEIITFISAIVAGFPLPLLPVQILWVNLVTDGFATSPLSVEPAEGDVLQQPPRNPREPVIPKRRIPRIAMVAVIMTVGTLGLFAFQLHEVALMKSRTMAFAALAIFQLFNTFNARSSVRSIFTLGLLTNPLVILGVGASLVLQILVIQLPYLQAVFRTTSLDVAEWLVVIAVSSTVLIVEEIRKAINPHIFEP